METTGHVDARRAKRAVALSLGAFVAATAVVIQAFLALWFASHTPESVWRTSLGVVLGLAAPAAGAVAYFRSGRAGATTAQAMVRLEFASAVVGLGLIVPTFVLVVISGVLSNPPKGCGISAWLDVFGGCSRYWDGSMLRRQK